MREREREFRGLSVCLSALGLSVKSHEANDSKAARSVWSMWFFNFWGWTPFSFFFLLGFPLSPFTLSGSGSGLFAFPFSRFLVPAIIPFPLFFSPRVFPGRSFRYNGSCKVVKIQVTPGDTARGGSPRLSPLSPRRAARRAGLGREELVPDTALV